MKAKIDLEKFICSYVKYGDIQDALKDQGLKCWNDEIVEIPQESEDERIREELISFIRNDGWKFTKLTKEEKESWIDWIEMQSGQKPIDNLEPKFKVGDWLQYRNAKPFFVEEITKQGYVNGDSCLPFNWENEIHLWTIADAKDGDVLAYVTDEEDLWIMIYWSLYEPYEGHVHYHALLVNDNFSDKGTCCICINDLKPATKEQRELLFQKMTEAGYEWDAEKKELREIEKQGEMSSICEIYDSIYPQNKWKPSDKQLDALHDAAVYVDKSMFPYPKGTLMKLYKQIKKLKEDES